MAKGRGSPVFFSFVCLWGTCSARSLLGCIEVVGSSRTASLTSVGNSRLLGSDLAVNSEISWKSCPEGGLLGSWPVIKLYCSMGEGDKKQRVSGISPFLWDGSERDGEREIEVGHKWTTVSVPIETTSAGPIDVIRVTELP